MIECVVNKCKLGEEKPDILYWRGRTPVERLEALEEIRRSYNAWRYGNAEQGLQRVLRIVKRPSR